MPKYYVKGFGKSMHPVRVKDEKELRKLKSENARLFNSKSEAENFIKRGNA